MRTNKDKKRGVSDLELAKALKGIRAVASDEQYERIQAEFSAEGDLERIASRVSALTEEDEFAVLCRMMGTVTHIVPLGQSPLIKGDSTAADFMARFQPGLWIDNKKPEDHKGYPCFVEVKSTSKLKLKISQADLLRRRSFAASFGLPLLFAVRFTRFPGNAYWVILHDSDWSKPTLTVSVKDLFSGLRHVLFNEYWYMLRPGTIFECVFDRATDEYAMRHAEYGGLLTFTIVNGDRAILFEHEEASLWSAFFEAYRLRKADSRPAGSRTTAAFEPGVAACSIIDLVYCFNSLPVDADGRRGFDASRMIARADLGQKSILIAERDKIDAGAVRMQQAGVLFLVGVGSVEDHRRLWAEYGGRT